MIATDKPIAFTTEWRLFFLGLLVVCQTLAPITYFQLGPTFYRGWPAFIPHIGVLLTIGIYFLIALFLALIVRVPIHWRALLRDSAMHGWSTFLMLQLLSYACAIGMAHVLVSQAIVEYQAWWRFLLLIGTTATMIFSLLLMAPLAYWRHFLEQEKIAIMLALVFAIGAFLITNLTQGAWDVLSAPTLHLSRAMLGLLYGDAFSNSVTRELGTSRFEVIIDVTCSGYEGIGMITAFLTWYIVTFRKDVRFPNIFLLYPVGIVFMGLFNCLRIATLIAIGTSFSPEVALNGFHSHAGWICFLAISLGLILASRNMAFFSATPSRSTQAGIDPQDALLIPQLVLLAATLLTAAFATSFEWLYPLRVLATGVTLALLWRHYDSQRISLHWFPVGIGILIFFIWLQIVPASPEKNTAFVADLSSVPGYVALGWVLVRLIGAILIVPLAEELAFRGYLIDFFSRHAAAEQPGRFAWMPLLLTSVLFGILHGNWIAGIVAGLAFGLARYWRGRIADAVIAHATTNLLLSAYVLYYQQWSYW